MSGALAGKLLEGTIGTVLALKKNFPPSNQETCKPLATGRTIDPTTFQYVSAAESGASVPAIPFSVTAPPAISILVKAKNIGLDVWSDAGQ